MSAATRMTAVIALALAMAAGVMASSRGQDAAPENVRQEGEAFPITVSADPVAVYVTQASPAGAGAASAGEVLIKGTTLRWNNQPVQIHIAPDNGMRAITGKAIPDERGLYQLRFRPARPGNYTVTVTAPDENGTATGRFVALAANQLGERTERTLTRSLETARQVVDNLQKALDEDIPPSPAQEDAKRKVDQLKATLDRLRQGANPPGPLARAYLSNLPADALADPETNAELARIAEEADDLEEARVELARYSGRTREHLTCDQLAAASEAIKALSALLTLQASLMKTLLAFSNGIWANFAGNISKSFTGGSSTGGLAGEQLYKNFGVLTGLSQLAENAGSIGLDLLTYASDSLFSAYCQTFTGPVSAAFALNFRHKGEPWTNSHFRISGQLEVRYPKNARGGTTSVSGQIRGYGHSFKTYDNALWAMNPNLMRMALFVYKFEVPPLEIGAAAALGFSQGGPAVSANPWGAGVGALMPNSFEIKVRGRVNQKDLLLELGPTVHDFKAKHRVIAFASFLAPTMMVPRMIKYDLPYLDARHVFAKGTEHTAIRLPITRKGEVMVAERTFTSTRERPPATGNYIITMKACNPSC